MPLPSAMSAARKVMYEGRVQVLVDKWSLGHVAVHHQAQQAGHRLASPGTAGRSHASVSSSEHSLLWHSAACNDDVAYRNSPVAWSPGWWLLLPDSSLIQICVSSP